MRDVPWLASKSKWKRLAPPPCRRERGPEHRGCEIESLEARVLLAAAGAVYPTFRLWQPPRSSGKVAPYVSSSPTGTPPATMRHAYGVDVTSFPGIAGDGTGQTIAIVDAYSEPTIVSDLAAFNSYYNLPAPPSFTVVNQSGGTTLPAADARGGWGVETALDVEWAHAMAPKANILLVSANSASFADMYTAVDTARNWPGVSVVSMSWGANESSTSSSSDSHFVTPSGHGGVTFMASSGDYGAYGGNGSTTKIVGYPAASKNVVGVGGTTLTTGTGGSYGSESGWGSGTSSNTSGGSGGGISLYISQPAYQSGVVTQSTTKRTVPDVALDADPSSGVPVYSAYDNGSSTPWLQVGGTSLAAPMWAGVMAIVNQGRALAGLGSLNGPTEALPRIYTLPTSDFHDITTGNNGYAAGPGYDLITGLGTPIVNKIVFDLVGAGTPTVGAVTTGTSTVTSGGSVSLYASNVTDVGGAGTINSVSFYRESNGTAGLQTGGDTLVGAGVNSGGTWSLSAPTAGLADATYTYYAAASDGVTVGPAASVGVTVGGTGFGNWSTLAPIIAKVPMTVSTTLSTSIISGGTTWYTGAVDITRTLDRIRADNGPITASDGIVFVNSTGLALPTNRGTFYEFNVDPQTGSVPSFTTGQIPPPGPMHLLIDGSGDVYFSGDQYASAVAVYIGDMVVPTIGSFAANPAAVTLGDPTTLTASNVAETGGSIGSVTFYRESNGVAGLQTGSDTLVGSGAQDGTSWTAAESTASLTAGAYTYYAIATDTQGTASAVSSTTLNIVSPDYASPIAGTVLAWNTHGQTGFGTQGLAATTVATGAANSLGLTRGIGVGTSGSAASNAWGGNNWSQTTPASGLAAGDYVTFGFTLGSGYTTSLSSITLNYRHNSAGPDHGYWQYQLNSGSWNLIGDFTNQFPSASSGGGSITPISLAGIADLQNLAAGTTVNFRVVPYGSSGSSGAWYVYDGSKNTNDLVVKAAAVAAGTPAIGGFIASPATVTAGSLTLLTASDVAETGGTGTITGVDFYRETNGTAGLQVGSDALVGAGIQGGSTWLLQAATAGLAAGDYVFYAVATDSNSASSTAASTTLTIVPPSTVAARQLFYNNSSLDGGDSALNAADDNAIATDKSALLAGQTSSAANFTSYSRGINGLMIDLTPLPAHAAISAADFSFKVGNDSTASGWASGPAPSQVLVRAGAGTGGADRVEIAWPDSLLTGKWLQVTVLADANTGLASPDVFYFGNEPGDSNGDGAVNFSDLVAVAQNYGMATTGPSQGDFNADGMTDFSDLVAVSQNYGTSLATLDLTAAAPATAAATTMAAASMAASVAPVTASVAASVASAPVPVEPADAAVANATAPRNFRNKGTRAALSGRRAPIQPSRPRASIPTGIGGGDVNPRSAAAQGSQSPQAAAMPPSLFEPVRVDRTEWPADIFGRQRLTAPFGAQRSDRFAGV